MPRDRTERDSDAAQSATERDSDAHLHPDRDMSKFRCTRAERRSFLDSFHDLVSRSRVHMDTERRVRRPSERGFVHGLAPAGPCLKAGRPQPVFVV